MNIFMELEKHKPRETITPEENFFTQSFEYVLSKHPKYAKEFVNYIAQGKTKGPYFFNTQVQYGTGKGKSIIDLEIKEKGTGEKFLLEIKLESPEAPNQVQKYVDLRKGSVIFISKYDEDIDVKDNRFLGQYLWGDIYRNLRKFIEKNKIPQRSTLVQFLQFMEVKGMKKGFEGVMYVFKPNESI
jgi:hypothetical protein